ncbi:MAG: hypothetical protein ACI81R_001817 [Bradymonadia bacterium]|jgi:hypothetical protein
MRASCSLAAFAIAVWFIWLSAPEPRESVINSKTARCSLISLRDCFIVPLGISLTPLSCWAARLRSCCSAPSAAARSFSATKRLLKSRKSRRRTGPHTPASRARGCRRSVDPTIREIDAAPHGGRGSRRRPRGVSPGRFPHRTPLAEPRCRGRGARLHRDLAQQR